MSTPQPGNSLQSISGEGDIEPRDCTPAGDYQVRATWLGAYYVDDPTYCYGDFETPCLRNVSGELTGFTSMYIPDRLSAVLDAQLDTSVPSSSAGAAVSIRYKFGDLERSPYILLDEGRQFFFWDPSTPREGTWETIVPPGNHTISAYACSNRLVGSTTITVPDGDCSSATLVRLRTNASCPVYSATGQILDGSAMETKTPISSGQNVYAQVPLGLELQLGVQKNGSYLPAKFDLGKATIPDLGAPALYPTNALLEYSRNVHVTQKTFRGVHIGTQQLTITPDDTTIPPFTFTLGVFDPGALGNTHVEYDPMIVTWGSRRGIPPHILKGLIMQESDGRGLSPDNYRYEPMNTSGVGEFEILDHIDDEPYASYRLQTASGDSKGALILDQSFPGQTYMKDDDVSPRKRFLVPRGPNRAPIKIRPIDECPNAANVGAGCVSVAEIIANNDKVYHWSRHAAPRYRSLTPSALADFSFTAQTHLAASYGLMQAMYTNVALFNWHANNGAQNPSLLFDTPANIAVGGGSMSLGTLEFYAWYRQCTDGDLATNPDFPDSDDYKDVIIDALNCYNHGDTEKTTIPFYGSKAWDYSQQFSPTHPLSKVFP